MRVGLLSTANINQAILGGAAATDAAEVVAVASRDLDRAKAYAHEHGLARAHGSYEALFDDPEVDAVYVSLPNSLHVEWSIKALEAGKHVLCEKPLTRHPEDAERAFDAAERAGRVLQEAFMWRYTPQTDRLLELLPRVGELRIVRTAFSFPQREPGDVRLNAELEGGALMDVGCYCISGIRLVAGEPEAVSGHQTLSGEGVDVLFTGTMRMAGGVLGHFDCGMTTSMRDELEVVGSEASLFLDEPWKADPPVIELRDGQGGVERFEVEARNPYSCELEELAAVSAGEREPRFAREDSVAQARVIHDLYASAGAA
jgi:xylose dehydrogenase (NAD/NADP)